MEKWFIKMKKADFEAIAGKYHISPITARLIRNRDIVKDADIRAYLSGTAADLHDGMQMKGMQKAADILTEKIREKKKIRIIGDYDIDGVNATYILQQGFLALGASADTDIPDRIKDGYGLNRTLIDRALTDGVDTIVTCDNGIAAEEEIAYGKEQGLTIIVTDHHQVPYTETPETAAGSTSAAEEGGIPAAAGGAPGAGGSAAGAADNKFAAGFVSAAAGTASAPAGSLSAKESMASASVPGGCRRVYHLPPADAVVDPHQPGCTYPFKDLCGAAVAYKLVEVLLRVNGRDPAQADYLLENVAIATVGDVMDLTGENRIFVKLGLSMLPETKNEGLKALIACTGLAGKEITAYHIGFILGPCINAGGRLDTAKRSLALLNAKTPQEAVMLAEDLKALNDRRKDLTEKGVDEAVRQIETTELGRDRVLVVYLPDCHESIAGIVAGRIREKYYRPTFVLTRGETEVKGSGRSIESYDMYAHLTAVKELLLRFGGHKMAAGLSLEERNVEAFRRAINAMPSPNEEELQKKISIDMRLPFAYISEELIEELKLLEPFGKGNPKPLFAGTNITVLGPRILGKKQNVLKCRLEDEHGWQIDAVYFGDVQGCMKEMRKGRRMAFTYYPSVDEYRGRKTLQVVIENYR